MAVTFHERNVTLAEGKLMGHGIDENAADYGDFGRQRKAVSFVALDGDDWIGLSSGWAPVKNGQCGDWFYLAELFVEEGYRGHGLGAELLRCTEESAAALGVGNTWTWTAGYEAPEFYKKQGYSVYAEMDSSYSSGHARVGIFKPNTPSNAVYLKRSGTGLRIEERAPTEAELERMNRGFEIHSEKHGNPSYESERISFVAVDGGAFVGTSTGLVAQTTDGYSAWFGITELVVLSPHRGSGVGSRLLQMLEAKLIDLEILKVWLWAAEYEAAFFLRHGYKQFFRMEEYHPSGHARLGLQKTLVTRG